MIEIKTEQPMIEGQSHGSYSTGAWTYNQDGFIYNRSGLLYNQIGGRVGAPPTSLLYTDKVPTVSLEDVRP